MWERQALRVIFYIGPDRVGLVGEDGVSPSELDLDAMGEVVVRLLER